MNRPRPQLPMLLFAMLSLNVPAGAQPSSPGLGGKLRALLGIPYVEDAGLDERGRWTRFSHPDQTLDQPGLNCSGFLVAAARRLLGFRGNLAEAARDRLGDSGPEAKEGQDWDFGWDLVLNLSEGHPRCWVLPGADHPAPGASGRSLPGFRVQDRAAWTQLSARWHPGRVYLATLRRGTGASLQHHHVALLLKGETGELGFYQTLPGGRVHRLALDTPAGLDRLCAMFGPGERILILEVQP